MNIAKLLRAAFSRTPPVAASADVLFHIIFSKGRCGIYCSYALHNCFVLKPKITLIRFIRFHSLYHSLSFVGIRCHSLSLVVLLVVLLVVTRCHSLYHSLSFAVACGHSLSFIVTHYHSLSLIVLLVVTHCTTRCHSLYHSLLFVVTRCHLLYHSFSLDVPLVCLFINDHFVT